MRTKVTQKKSRGQDEGFTLIETMIAVFVLTVAILALVSVTVMVIKGNSLSKTMTTATTLARDQMETLKNTSYAGIGSTSYAAVTGFPGYERRWTVTTSTTPPNQKKIVMEVRWTWQGTPHTVALETIIAE